MERIISFIGKSLKIIGKTVLITLLLASINLILLYTVEITGIYVTKPNAIAKPYDNHFKNLYRTLPFFLIYVGWLFFIVVIIFHWIVTVSSMTKLWEYVSGISIVLFIFLAFIILIEPRMDVFLQGLIVYPVLGFFLVTMHNTFWRTSNEEN